ncbi:MAG: AmmeMemoRadiSam system protein B [Aquificae bacterium]|nr:AmmeMemoRadiSam system protein B [Aquificota bacterium]
MSVRRPAVAGTFYPASPEELIKLMDLLCGEEPPKKIKAKAILVPHAGYVYSGRTACEVYKRVEIPPEVVLLGPNHTGYGAPISVYGGDAWETPFGVVEIDKELREEVLKYPYARADELAHLYEHSLEVQVPFLQRYAKQPFKILPIVLAFLEYEVARDFGRFLGSILKERDALIVISTDMSHYVSAEEARKKDEILIAAMERLNTEELYFKALQYNISMCGVVPAVVGIEAAKVMGAKRGIVVDYSNSGDVTGDYSQVVAYLGMIFV